MAVERETIECCRAGAIGDTLMTTPAIRALRQKYPQAHIRYVTQTPDLLIGNPDIDELSMVRKEHDQEILFEYPMAAGYPDKPLENHLAFSFADCAGLEIDSPAGFLNFTEHEMSFVKSIMDKFQVPVATIHVKAGWSPYKEWPIENWQKIVNHFFGRIAFLQIGTSGEPALDKSIVFNGLLSVRLAAACVSMTDLFVGIDSYPNHVAGACGKPAVVLFGSTSPAGSGYDSAVNIWTGEDCSPCYREYNSIAIHKKQTCPAAMKCQKNISVSTVIAAIEKQLLGIHK